MKLTGTQIFTFLYNLICVLAAILGELQADTQIWSLIPPKYAHAIAIAAMALMFIKSHRNLFINPDGTKAVVAYQPPAPTVPSSGQKGAALWVDVCILLCFVALACGVLFSPIIHKHLRDAAHARQIRTVQTSGR